MDSGHQELPRIALADARWPVTRAWRSAPPVAVLIAFLETFLADAVPCVVREEDGEQPGLLVRIDDIGRTRARAEVGLVPHDGYVRLVIAATDETALGSVQRVVAESGLLPPPSPLESVVFFELGCKRR